MFDNILLKTLAFKWIHLEELSFNSINYKILNDIKTNSHAFKQMRELSMRNWMLVRNENKKIQLINIYDNTSKLFLRISKYNSKVVKLYWL